MIPQANLALVPKDICRCPPESCCQAYGTPVCRVSNGPQAHIAVQTCLGGHRAVMRYWNPETKAYEDMAHDGEVYRSWWEAHDHALTWAIEAKLELK